MKKRIEAVLWFFAILFSFGNDYTNFYGYDKTAIVLNGASAALFGGLVWWYFWGYKRVKPPVQ